MSDLRAEFILQAIALDGTPYHLHQCVAGVGIDCIHVPILAARNAGLTSVPLAVPKSQMGYSAVPSGNSLMIALDDYLDTVTKSKMIPGDIPMFRLETDPQHLAVLIDKTRFIHADMKKGVKISDLTPRWYERIRKVYRIPEFN